MWKESERVSYASAHVYYKIKRSFSCSEELNRSEGGSAGRERGKWWQ